MYFIVCQNEFKVTSICVDGEEIFYNVSLSIIF